MVQDEMKIYPPGTSMSKHKPRGSPPISELALTESTMLVHEVASSPLSFKSLNNSFTSDQWSI